MNFVILEIKTEAKKRFYIELFQRSSSYHIRATPNQLSHNSTPKRLIPLALNQNESREDLQNEAQKNTQFSIAKLINFNYFQPNFQLTTI